MLSIRGLHKRFGDVDAVSGATLSVPEGRIVGFVGPNGAGKSTTMRAIFGLVRPDAGSITWNGGPVDAAILARFGYMPEQRGLYAKMKIVDQVSYFAELKGRGRKAARSAAVALLEELDLGDRLEDPLEELSHGNQQRVQLAVSMVHDPDVLVLDEPFNGLDPVAVEVLESVLRERAQRGVGVLFSSHQLDLVDSLCDDVTIIVNGRIRADGSVMSVRRSSGDHRLTIGVEHPLMPLADALAGFSMVRASTREVRLAVADESELDAILAAARQAGPIDTLRFEPPTLTEVFATLAADEQGPSQ